MELLVSIESNRHASSFHLLHHSQAQLFDMGCLGSKDRLTKEDMEFLKSHTRYDETTIKEWYKGFKVR